MSFLSPEDGIQEVLPEVSKDPVSIAERSQRVGAEICCLQARGPGLGNSQRGLEMFVQSVKQTVREAPKEEQNGH